MSNESRLPILRVRPADVAARVLVVGDPSRARAAAERLDGVEKVGDNREYVTFTGRRAGKRISVASHGVGSAGAGVCFEELARAGARTVVRAGTCGALSKEVGDGQLIVATGAVRDEGLTPRLVPLAYPAVVDPELFVALRRAAEEHGAPSHAGVILTSDLFYPSRALGIDWRPWQEARVLAVEMELATLLIVASLHGMRAAGILTVDGNPTLAAEDMSEYDPYRSVVATGTATMVDTALTALERQET